MKLKSVVARPRAWYQNFGIRSLQAATVAGALLVAAGFLVRFPGSIPPGWHRLNGEVSGVTGKIVNGKTVYYPVVQFLAFGYSYETPGGPTTVYPTVGAAVPVAYNPNDPDVAKTLSAALPNYFKLLFPTLGVGSIAFGSYAYTSARRRARPEVLEVVEESVTEEAEVAQEIEAVTETEVEASIPEEAAPEVEAEVVVVEAEVQPEEVAVAEEPAEVVSATAEPAETSEASEAQPSISAQADSAAVITPTQPPEEPAPEPKKPGRAAKAIAKMVERKDRPQARPKKAAVGVSAQRLAATLKKPGAKRKPAKPMLTKDKPRVAKKRLARVRKAKGKQQSNPKKEAIMLSRLDHPD